MFEIFKPPMNVVSVYTLDETYTGTIALHAKMMVKKYRDLVRKNKEGK